VPVGSHPAGASAWGVQELVGNQVDELRVRIENAVTRFSMHVSGDKRARVGISVGTATFGIDGETLDQLLITADQAMYRVKSTHKLEPNGRNAQADTGVVQTPNGELASTSVN